MLIWCWLFGAAACASGSAQELHAAAGGGGGGSSCVQLLARHAAVLCPWTEHSPGIGSLMQTCHCLRLMGCGQASSNGHITMSGSRICAASLAEQDLLQAAELVKMPSVRAAAHAGAAPAAGLRGAAAGGCRQCGWGSRTHDHGPARAAAAGPGAPSCWARSARSTRWEAPKRLGCSRQTVPAPWLPAMQRVTSLRSLPAWPALLAGMRAGRPEVATRLEPEALAGLGHLAGQITTRMHSLPG